MSIKENEAIEKLLKLYPDVIEDLGGEAILTNGSIIEKIGSYIKSHKWFVNQNLPFTISLEQAFFSWHENVFMPQWNEMVKTNITNVLNHLNKFEIFKLVSGEYYFQNNNDNCLYYTRACLSVINKESHSFLSREIAKVKLSRIA